MLFVSKKISTALILLPFLTVALLNFAAMTYAADGSMQGDCPFSTVAASLCPSGALPGAIHHINAFQSFLNVPVSSAIIALITSLLIIVISTLTFLFHPLLYKPLAFVSYHPTPFTSQNRKIKRWLSLFEHSPSRL
ncbi:hypothetical protein HY415_02710 [Candidatus Kaiserbacteria bacterium]|nr:hypothetical protein [Candidatus Kaiserbacteria bacterium]